MVFDLRRIKMSLCLTLMLPLAAETLQQSYFTAGEGHDVTLSCENVMDTCDHTSWLLTDSRNTATVELVTFGHIDKYSRSRSDRLSLTQNCSLVVKKVTGENAGRYTCITFDKSGQSQDTQVDLSVVRTTEHEDDHTVTLTCRVTTYGWCRHTVTWLLRSEDGDEDSEDLKTSKSDCSANVTFGTSGHDKSKIYGLWKCSVIHTVSGKVQQFNFRPQPTGKNKTTTTTTTAATMGKTTNYTMDPTADAATTKPQVTWWRLIFVLVGLAAISLTLASVSIWTRTKGHKTHPDIAVRYQEGADVMSFENRAEPSASVRH